MRQIITKSRGRRGNNVSSQKRRTRQQKAALVEDDQNDDEIGPRQPPSPPIVVREEVLGTSRPVVVSTVSSPSTPPSRRPYESEEILDVLFGTDGEDEDENEEESATSCDNTTINGGNSESEEDECTNTDDSSSSSGNSRSYESSTAGTAMIKGTFGDDIVNAEAPGFDLVARLVSKDPSLTVIAIEESSITSSAMAKHMAEALQQTTYLHKITLIGSWSGQHASTSDVGVILGGIAGNSSIQSLVLQDMKMDRETGFSFGCAINRHKSLKRLGLTNCEFIGAGLAVFLMGIQQTIYLETLDVRSCNLGGPSLDVVASFLSTMHLKFLCLQNASITMDGLPFLMARLEEAETIVELDLSYNILGPESVKLVAACLQSPYQNIGTLRLSGCAIDRSCIRIFTDCIFQNSTLQHIDLTGNPFGDRGAMRLISALETNHTVKTLDVTDCRISTSKLKLLSDKLRYNNSFLKSVFSTETSLAILDSVNAMENLSTQYLGSPKRSS